MVGPIHTHIFPAYVHAYLWALLGKVSCFSDKNFERKKDTQKHDNILHQHSIQKIVLGQEKMGKCLCFVSLNSPFRFLPCFSQIGSPPPPNTTCTHNYVVCLKIWSLLRLYSTVRVIGCKSCRELFLLVRCTFGRAQMAAVNIVILKYWKFMKQILQICNITFAWQSKSKC